MFGLIFSNCDNNCVDYTTSFINNSGRAIEITSYKNYYPNIPFGTFSKKINIINGNQINNVIKECSGYGGDALSMNDVVAGDSIVIDFGDRKLRYGVKNLSSTRNPFLFTNYATTSRIYTLTSTDYANAQ